MTETKLPVLPCCCGVMTASGRHECDNCKVLLAHEQHYEQRISELESVLVWTKTIDLEWRENIGAFKALQRLRRGTK